MKFKIEYLKESTDESSVCHVRLVRAETLDEAGRSAWEGSFIARRLFDANGFQIRDLSKGGEIVALETFE